MKLFRTAAITLATVAVALAPTAAFGGTYHHSDATHDVVSINDDTDAVTAEPDRDNGDIVTSGVTYGPRRVTLAMRYGALAKPSGFTEHYFSVVTSKGKARTFLLLASQGRPQGSLLKVTGRGKKVTCKGIHWSIGYGRRLVTLSVPARCLGKPAWVRGAMASVDVDDFQDDSSPLFLDDSNTTGFTAESTPRYGPRVHR